MHHFPGSRACVRVVWQIGNFFNPSPPRGAKTARPILKFARARSVTLLQVQGLGYQREIAAKKTKNDNFLNFFGFMGECRARQSNLMLRSAAARDTDVARTPRFGIWPVSVLTRSTVTGSCVSLLFLLESFAKLAAARRRPTP